MKSAFMRGLEKSGLQFTKVTVTDRAGKLMDRLSIADTALERLRCGGPVEGDGCARCASPRHAFLLSSEKHEGILHRGEVSESC